MLVLMRRPGESIYIGSDIVVTLVEIEDRRARIGITAPREITIDRKKITEENTSNPPPANDKR